jgi:putative aldouronate transport system substrate-binding protein
LEGEKEMSQPRFKQRLALRLVPVITALALMSACSDGGQQASKEEANAPKGNTDKPMKIMSWTNNPDQLVQNGYTERFMEKKYNIDIEMVGRSNTYLEELRLRIASGDIPDWFSEVTFQDYDKFVKQGVLAEIPIDLLEKTAPRYVAWLKKFLGNDPYKYYKRDGKLYSMPYLWTVGINNMVLGMREDWLQQVGIMRQPETLDELEQAFIKFRNNDPDNNGKKDTYGMTGKAETPTDIFNVVFGAYGVYPGIFVEQNGKVARGEIQPGAKDALTLLNKWYKEELIDPEFMVNKNNNVEEKFIVGAAGAVQNSWWTFVPQRTFFSGKFYEAMTAKNPSIKLAVLNAPKGPTGQQGMIQTNPVRISGLLYGKHLDKDRAKLTKYLQLAEETNFDVKMLEMSYYGEEGVTFKKTGEGSYEFIPPYDQLDARNKYGVNRAAYPIPGHFNDYEMLTPFMTDQKLLPLRKEMEKKGTGKYDILLPLPKPLYSEYSDRLDKYTTNQFVQFISGKRPLSQFDQFVEEWNKMGGSKVMEEAQKVYDEYLK